MVRPEIQELVDSLSAEEVHDMLHTLETKFRSQWLHEASMYGSLYASTLRLLGYTDEAARVDFYSKNLK